MKRPLDIIFATGITGHPSTVMPGWTHRMEAALRWAFQMPLPVVTRKTTEPALIFDSLHDVMSRLHLENEEHQLETNKALLCPIRSPLPDDPSRHFAQRAVIWEPADEALFRKKTLRVVVGADQRLLSLTFVPYAGRSHPDDYRFQLDDIKIHSGHDVYEITPDMRNHEQALACFAAGSAVIKLIHDDYPLAETTLLAATDPIISAFRGGLSPETRVLPPLNYP